MSAAAGAIAAAQGVANVADLGVGGSSQRRRFTFAREHDTAAAAKEDHWRGGDLSYDEEWISAVRDRSQKIYKRVAISFDATAAACTHAGFIQYLHACWAAERGVVLRPDIIWHTILCELARMAQDKPDDYCYLFTGDRSQRKDLEVATFAPSELDARALAEVVRQNMREPALADVVLSPCFASAPPLAAYAAAAALCAMGEPYYCYMTSFCGISSVDVVGDRSEWESLQRAIARLMAFGSRPQEATPSEIPPHPAEARGVAGPGHGEGAIPAVVHHEGTPPTVEDCGSVNLEPLSTDGKWLADCKAVVQDIVHWGFDATEVDGRTRFFADVFHYGKSHKCGSGHATMLVSGWARRLVNTDHEDIADMPRHVSVIPFVNKETGRRFVQAVSLAYSEATLDGLAWEPQYGIATFEAVARETDGRSLFDVLSLHAADSCVLFQVAAALKTSPAPKFVAAGGLPLLMDGLRLHSKNRYVVKCVSDAIVLVLHACAHQPEPAVAAMQGVQRFNGIATLLQSLEDTDDDAARKSAATALGAFSRPTLVDALVRFKHNGNVVRAIAAALRQSPPSVNPVTAAASNAAVMPVLLEALRFYASTPDVAEAVITTIHTLAERRTLVPRDGVPLLLTILKERPRGSYMFRAVVSALFAIATKSPGGLAMFHAADIATLVCTVRAHSADSYVASDLARLCDILVQGGREHCAAFVHNGAVPLFADMVHRHGIPVAALAWLSMSQLVAALQEAVCGPEDRLWRMLQGLKTVTADDEQVAAFVHAGGLLPLVRALELHGDQESVAYRAVDTLGKLATSAVYAPLLVRAGGASALRRARLTMMSTCLDGHAVDRITHLLNALELLGAGAEPSSPPSAVEPEPV